MASIRIALESAEPAAAAADSAVVRATCAQQWQLEVNVVCTQVKVHFQLTDCAACRQAKSPQCWRMVQGRVVAGSVLPMTGLWRQVLSRPVTSEETSNDL
jgi:hypothetical protein